MRERLKADVIYCEECTRQGRTAIGTIADHIVPLSKGGGGERSNYQLLCKPCSDAKTLADKGHVARPVQRGVDVNGWPADPNHSWRR